MTYRTKDERKASSMERMRAAIERAMTAETDTERERAARWAAAWGALCGIRTPGIRLRRSVLVDSERTDRVERRAHPR